MRVEYIRKTSKIEMLNFPKFISSNSKEIENILPN